MMNREPKVACVELGCILRGVSKKDNEHCKECASRWTYLDAIENGGIGNLPTIGNIEEAFATDQGAKLDFITTLEGYLDGLPSTR